MNPQNNSNEVNPNDLYPQRPANQQAPSVPGQTPPQSSAPMTPNKSHLWLKIVIAVVLFVIAAGVAAAFYFHVFELPSTSVKNTVSKMDSIKSAHTEVIATVDIKQAGKSQVSKVTISSDGDRSDIDNPKMSSKIAFAGQGLTADGEIRFIDNVVYMRLNEFPLLGMIPGTTNIQGIWYSISKKEIEDLAKSYGPNAKISIADKSKVPTNGEVYDIFMKHNVIGPIRSLGVSKSSDGTLVRSYSIQINKENLLPAVIDLVTKYNTTGKPLPSMEELKKPFDETIKAFTFDTVTVQVGLTDGNIKKLDFGAGFAPDATMRGLPFEGVHVGIQSQYSKVNEKLTFEVPTDAQPLAKLIEASMGSAQQKGNDAMIKSLISTSRAQAELYFDKTGSYSGLCGSFEIKAISDTLYSKGIALSCSADAARYVNAAPLSNRTYFCADSTGLATTIPGMPVGKSCK